MARRRDQFGPFPVPPDSFFGMGDNRDNSLDSRYWGAIPRANIFGRPGIIYWSYEAEPNSHIWRGPVAKIRQLAEVGDSLLLPHAMGPDVHPRPLTRHGGAAGAAAARACASAPTPSSPR